PQPVSRTLPPRTSCKYRKLRSNPGRELLRFHLGDFLGYPLRRWRNLSADITMEIRRRLSCSLGRRLYSSRYCSENVVAGALLMFVFGAATAKSPAPESLTKQV
ncbi:unnamed protein product, partial [Sphacelaria rigidula]